jgi:hypothetical protein
LIDEIAIRLPPPVLIIMGVAGPGAIDEKVGLPGG